MRSAAIGYNTLEIVFGIFLVLALLPIWKQLEPKLFPVVEDFTVEEVIPVEGGIAAQGTMKKVRQCQFKSLVIYGKAPGAKKPQLLDYSFEIEAKTSSRVTGSQNWGPWMIYIEGVSEGWTVSMFAYHECTNLYTLTSKLTEFTIGED